MRSLLRALRGTIYNKYRVLYVDAFCIGLCAEVVPGT